MKTRTLVLTMLATCVVVSISTNVGLSKKSQPQQTKPSQSIVGNWLGVLKIGEVNLRLLVKIESLADGSLKAVMDSLDQANSNNLTVDSVVLQNNSLRFEMKAL